MTKTPSRLEETSLDDYVLSPEGCRPDILDYMQASSRAGSRLPESYAETERRGAPRVQTEYMPRQGRRYTDRDPRMGDLLAVLASVPPGPTSADSKLAGRQRLHVLLAIHPWLDDPTWPIGGHLRSFADAYRATHAADEPIHYLNAIEHVRRNGTTCERCAAFKKMFRAVRASDPGAASTSVPTWLE
jgi:hypothetical protein